MSTITLVGDKMEKLRCKRTVDGYAYWVGGGATTSRFSFTAVLNAFTVKPDNVIQVLDLPRKAIFIRGSGHLACSHEQALVPLKEGDYIVECSGTLPIVGDNPDIDIISYCVHGFSYPEGDEFACYADCELQRNIQVENIPVRVILGAATYHNRSGKYFVKEAQETQEDAS